MEYKSPQQQIFDKVFTASMGLGYSTFDYLPASSVGYPFVFIGEQSDQDRQTKTSLYGDVQQTIHFFHSYKKRRELTGMMDKLKTELRKVDRTENFYVVCRNVSSRIMIDQSTSEPLLHGVLEVEFRFH